MLGLSRRGGRQPQPDCRRASKEPGEGGRRSHRDRDRTGRRLRPSPGRAPAVATASQLEGLVAGAIEAGIDSWRLALPAADHLALEQLRWALAIDPSNARAAGMLALLCRHAAEYGGHIAASEYVRECEVAARKAIALDRNAPEARTALATVLPLFGRWGVARRELTALIDESPEPPFARQELATLEMATGRISEGKRLRDELIAADPLAAAYCYKSVYQHWAVGDLGGMDHAADRAIQLWPNHPAVWMVRFWTLACTGRGAAALAMLDVAASRPQVPEPFLQFLRQVVSASVTGAAAEVNSAVEQSVALARNGPANAVASFFALGLFERVDEAFQVAERYYFRGGTDPVPLGRTALEPSLNEQHRRLTQVLFMPVCAGLRADPRFLPLCERIGLADYWESAGLTPDFLN